MLTKAGERLAATGPAQCPTPRSALLMTAPHRGRCRDETARIRESVRRSGAGGGVSRRNRLPREPIRLLGAPSWYRPWFGRW